MSRDPYAEYLHRFFARWGPVYDLFAAPIAFVYRAAVRWAGAAPGRRLLDLCTGTGEIARRASRRGAQVVGVDFTAGMVRQAARKAPRARFVLADARHLPFAEAAFDVALLSFALHDMPKAVRQEVLAEAARTAREGLVVVDYRFGPGWLGRLFLAAIASFETAYLRGFASAGGAEAALHQAGLAITATRTFGPLPFVVYRVAGRS
ncbi:MAG TPA: methyltransferase domain-containing protein [Thermoanaerobaculia bacterium]|nr:methyltransferase domain-containing protein [Thermoanaerobaculia bacterium]